VDVIKQEENIKIARKEIIVDFFIKNKDTLLLLTILKIYQCLNEVAKI